MEEFKWKYNEGEILDEFIEYLKSTYKSHYCGTEEGSADIQTIDLAISKGRAPDFCQVNLVKYGDRYGQKNGKNKMDLFKAMHYAMLLLHSDKHYS